MLQAQQRDTSLSSQDVFSKPPYWDSGSLHSLLQGRHQWQIKLLVLFSWCWRQVNSNLAKMMSAGFKSEPNLS